MIESRIGWKRINLKNKNCFQIMVGKYRRANNSKRGRQ